MKSLLYLGVIAALGLSGLARADGRPGTVTFSDGKTLTGGLLLTPGKELRIYTDDTTNVSLSLADVKEMRFKVVKEEMRKGFYFPTAGQAVQAETGDVYPVRYFTAEIALTDGRTLTGHLLTTMLYVQNDDGTQKVALMAKMTGQDGQKIDDLVYPADIHFDAGVGAAGSAQIDLTQAGFTPKNPPVIFAKPDLTLLPGAQVEGKQVWTVPVEHPENVLFSVEAADGIHISWPANEAGADVQQSVQQGLTDMHDFYDSRTLLDCVAEDDDLYTLVMLKRIGPMVDGAGVSIKDGRMPWTLAAMHWKYDTDTKKVTLLTRAVLVTGIAYKNSPPPAVLKQPELLRTITTQAPTTPPATNQGNAMTTRQAPHDALIRAAKALRFALLIQAFVRWGAISAGGLLALFALDNFLHLPQALRLPLGVVLGGWIVVEFLRKILMPAFRKFTPSYAARWLETHRGIGGNVLINAHQFEQDGLRPEWAEYIAPILNSSRSILGDIPPRSIWLTPQLKKWFGGLALVVVVWVTLVAVFPRYVVNGMERIFMPLADIPPVGSWLIDLKPTGSVKLVEGDKLDITVGVKSALGFHSTPPVPELVWQEGLEGSEESHRAGEHASMLPGGKPGEFTFSFSGVHQAFTFFVEEDDTRSVAVSVEVLPLPELKSSSFHVTPPAYTGLKAYNQPGPPASIEVPEGSMVTAALELSAETAGMLWRSGTAATDKTEAMKAANGGWTMDRLVNDSGSYQVLAKLPTGGDPRVLAEGQITATPDHPPEVDFVTQDRNRAENPGGSVAVKVKATDDYGVAWITLLLASSDDPSNTRAIKAWKYLGPPGDKEPAPENDTIALDPDVFTPGSTYLLTAQAGDFSPAGQKTTSRPIVLRVAGLADMAVPEGDVLQPLFDLLRTTIVQQTQANGQTDTLALHVAEALAANDVAHHCQVMNDAQTQTQATGAAALDEAGKHDEAKMYIARLEPLVHGEMDLARGQITNLHNAPDDALPTALGELQKRQVYILNNLIALLGQMASDRQQAASELAKKKSDEPLSVTVEQEMAKLKDELKAFTDAQKKIIAASKQIKDLDPEDLTNDQQAVLGELAREEAKQAAYFQEKLTDLSKLPTQDFGDGKVVSDLNEVYQEVQAAAQQLYQKRPETAVPAEGAAWEKAAEIVQNLEKWLPNAADNTKWSMENSPQQPDIPMAELPKSLDDVVGDLLKKQDELNPDKDDPSSTAMDSADKGVGWAAFDGPISNMSAKGITGNQSPNNNEIGGRSGEGRNGKSDGEMVGSTAEGKGGNETPTRETPAPFENGSVNDSSKDSKGGATGGGKLSGYGQEGMRGPQAPPVKGGGPLADQQAKLRQQAESLALQLRKQRRPTGDLESAIGAMKDLEDAERSQNGIKITQGYQQALDSLEEARAAYAGDRLSRVEADTLTRDASKDVIDTQAETAPAGYEEMTGAYFRSLSESNTTTTPPATDAK